MVNVIGLGYIGLPTALMLAAHGIEVVGTDIDMNIINKLNEGKITFTENGLGVLLEEAQSNGIVFTNEYMQANTYIIAVPTPYDKETKKIDPSYIINAVSTIRAKCTDGAIIIIESTVSPGTIDKFIRSMITEESQISKKLIHLAHAPERIIPGRMVYELEHNSRTIGADSRDIGEKVETLYSSFCKGEIIITDIRTAEMTKIVENTYRDINIAFANELAKICRCDGLNVYDIIRIANMHPRVDIMQPGPGVGGHCISVDPWFLVGDYPGLANIILTARQINDSMPEYVLGRIRDIMDEEDITDTTRVGLYGLTYKENVDDIRESPTLQLLETQRSHLATGLKVYDPYIKENVVENQYFDFDEFLSDIDFIVIMVGHNQIKENLPKLCGKIILDTRSIYDIKNKYTL